MSPTLFGPSFRISNIAKRVGLGSLDDVTLRSVAYIAGGNLSEVARMMLQSNEFRQAILKMIDQSVSQSGFKSLPAEKLFAEVFSEMKNTI
jgi:hypothetical protein